MSLPGLRPFRSQPLYALACSATLALAVAAAATSFAVIKRAILDPLPYPDGDRLVMLQTTVDNRTGAMSVFVLEDLKHAEQSVLTAFAPLRSSAPTYQTASSAESLDAHEVTTAFFDTFATQPAFGAVWTPTDPNAVIVSWRFWQRSLSARADAVGRTITLDGVSRQVVGVMPEGFLSPFGPDVDLWLPLDMRLLLADTARARRTVTVFARLVPGATLAHANAYLGTFTQVQRTQHPAIHSREGWVAHSLRDDLIGPTDTALVSLGAAAALLMLIVWANIAGLSAVNAAAHRRQYAIQAALGASAGRLFRDRLADSLTIASAGSLAGLGLAAALIRLAASYQPQFLPMLAPIAFEPATALVGFLLGISTGVFAALAPHGAMKRLQVEDALRAARGSTGDRRLATVRSTLVFAQVAIAIVLIVAAGLLVRTVTNLSETSLGFRTDRLTNFHVTLPLPAYRATERQLQFERDVRDRIAAIPGVVGVSASVGFPVMGTMGARLTILDRSESAAPPEIWYSSVSPRFFSFLEVPILDGRDIAETDDFPAPRVVVINETMARMFWPGGNAIGAKVKIGAGAPTDREITVVGIAADLRQNGPTQAVRPAAYGSTLQYSWPRRHIAVKTDRRLPSLAEQLRAAVRAVDPDIATTVATPIDNLIANQTARHTLVMLTLTFFGAVATLLCGLGLYAAVALNSQVRRREYAIRLAIGSSRSHVCWLVVRQALLLALAGAVAGLIAAASGTRALAGLLHGVTPVDAATFTAAFVAIVLLAAMSAALPAARAGRVDPAETLKAE